MQQKSSPKNRTAQINKARKTTQTLSICLRDSAFALHLRHTTECVLQRVLRFSVLSSARGYLRLLIRRWAYGRFPEKLHRDMELYISIHEFSELSTGSVTFPHSTPEKNGPERLP